MIIKPCLLDSWAVGQVGHVDCGHHWWKSRWVLSLRTVGMQMDHSRGEHKIACEFPGTLALCSSLETNEHKVCDHSK